MVCVFVPCVSQSMVVEIGQCCGRIQCFCMTINGSDWVEDSIVIAGQLWTNMAMNNNFFIGKQQHSCLSIINGQLVIANGEG